MSILGKIGDWVGKTGGVVSGLANPIGAGMQLAGGIMGYGANKRAQAGAEKAQLAGLGNQEAATTTGYNTAKGYIEPLQKTGMEDYNTLRGMTNSGAFAATPYGYQIGQAPQDQFNFKTDPGYQFRLNQGANQINSMAASKGNQLSGASQKALQRYGQNFASNEMTNAYNRFSNQRDFNQNQYQYGTTAGMTNEQNRYAAANQQGTQDYDRRAALGTVGINASTALGNMATAYGGTMAGYAGDRGNVIGRGYTDRGKLASDMWSNLGGMGAGVSQLGGGLSSLGGLMKGYTPPAAQNSVPSVFGSGSAGQIGSGYVPSYLQNRGY